jgi:hypothetical protein
LPQRPARSGVGALGGGVGALTCTTAAGGDEGPHAIAASAPHSSAAACPHGCSLTTDSSDPS